MKLILFAGILVASLLAAYPLASAATANITGYYDRPRMALSPGTITTENGATVTMRFQVEGDVTESISLHALNADPSTFIANYKVVIKEKKYFFPARTLQTLAFSNSAAFSENTDPAIPYASWPAITLHDGSEVVPSSLDEAQSLLFDDNYVSFLPKSLFETGEHMIYAEVTASWDSDLVEEGSVTERTFTYVIDVV